MLCLYTHFSPLFEHIFMEGYKSTENNSMERKIAEYKFAERNIAECKTTEYNIEDRIIAERKISDCNITKRKTMERKVANHNILDRKMMERNIMENNKWYFLGLIFKKKFHLVIILNIRVFIIIMREWLPF